MVPRFYAIVDMCYTYALSEVLIFIPAKHLVFARANAGVGGRGGGRDHREETLLCVSEFFFNS